MPPGIISPWSRLALLWEVVAALLLLYTAIVLPWRVAFGKRGMHAWDVSSPLSVLELFIDLFFFADMARSARTAYHEEVSGDLVTSSKVSRGAISAVGLRSI